MSRVLGSSPVSSLTEPGPVSGLGLSAADMRLAGRVYEHWYVLRPPLVRSSLIAATTLLLVTANRLF